MKGGYIRNAPPDPSLRDYISRYTFVDFPIDAARQMEFSVMPSSHTRMILFLGEPSLQEVKKTMQPVDKYGLTGFISRPHLFVPTTTLRQVMIHFTAWGIQPFIDFPLSDITDTRADLRHLFRHEIDALCQQLNQAFDIREKKYVLDAFFINQMQKARHIDERIRPIARYIYDSHGTLRLNTLSDAVCMGERTVQRLIHNSIGVPYKFFATLVRLEYVRKLLNSGERNLTHVALSAGYFDQAHFIHEFHAAFGENPGAYIRRKHMLVWNHVDLPPKKPLEQIESNH